MSISPRDLTRLDVCFGWRDFGGVVLDSGGKPTFDRLPEIPAVYRISMTARPGQVTPRRYVGESDNLRRRSGNYRNPGPSQRTSLRVNGLLREHLAAGGAVRLAGVIDATWRLDAEAETALDLTTKSGRLLVENAALLIARASGEWAIDNL